MSMNKHGLAQPLTADEAFAITLLVTCEVTKNLLMKRTADKTKRMYWLERLDKAIEGVNSTYDGHLPDYFHIRAKKYHQTIELAMAKLLKGYRDDAAAEVRL